jgi:glutaconate CoA-transferase subunit A
MPPLHLDVALVHLNRADRHGNARYLGPDPYFDDLFCLAAERRYVSCESIVEDVGADGPPQTLLLNRMMVDGVVETPRGAHFTSCVPDYGRDEEFQRTYAESDWEPFVDRYLSGDETAYQKAVAA